MSASQDRAFATVTSSTVMPRSASRRRWLRPAAAQKRAMGPRRICRNSGEYGLRQLVASSERCRIDVQDRRHRLIGELPMSRSQRRQYLRTRIDADRLRSNSPRRDRRGLYHCSTGNKSPASLAERKMTACAIAIGTSLRTTKLDHGFERDRKATYGSQSARSKTSRFEVRSTLAGIVERRKTCWSDPSAYLHVRDSGALPKWSFIAGNQWSLT